MQSALSLAASERQKAFFSPLFPPLKKWRSRPGAIAREQRNLKAQLLQKTVELFGVIPGSLVLGLFPKYFKKSHTPFLSRGCVIILLNNSQSLCFFLFLINNRSCCSGCNKQQCIYCNAHAVAGFRCDFGISSSY